MLLPLHLIATALLGLLSLVVLGSSLYLLYRILRQSRHVINTVPTDRTRSGQVVQSAPLTRSRFHIDWRDKNITVPLALGVFFFLFSFTGRYLVQYAFRSIPDEPQRSRQGQVRYVEGTAGSKLRVETYGRSDAPVLLFTHGWGMDSTEWFYAKRDLSDRFQLVLWDLPGLGLSEQPGDKNFALEKMAQDLRSVLATANPKPVTLVGHSIGGMINLTFCRLYPELLGPEVTKIIQVDTSYTNPVKTTQNRELALALQKPIGEPVLHAMVAFSPLVRGMNWLSYQNGTSYLMNAKSGFAQAASRGQIDLVTRLQTEASPAVVARGTLAMFNWDASPVLPKITIPVLLLVGDQDTTTLPEASRHMKENIPSSTLVVIGPAAHYSLLEQNQKVNSRIRAFAAAESGRQQTGNP